MQWLKPAAVVPAMPGPVGLPVLPAARELLPMMPVLYVKAVQVQSAWEASAVGHLRPEKDIYNSPVYITTFRGPTYICLATLKTKDPSSKWIQAGVALIMCSDD